MEKIRVENFEDIHTHTHTCNLKKKGKNEKAITLIALVIAIVILIILAGVVIVALGGENGLLTQEKQEKQAETSYEIERVLKSAIEDLKTEKSGDASLDDITQEWIEQKIKDYTCTIKYDGSIRDLKLFIVKNSNYHEDLYQVIIDENLDITQIENIENKLFRYEATSNDGNYVWVSITVNRRVRDSEGYSINTEKVICPDGREFRGSQTNPIDPITFEYNLRIGEKQIFKIIVSGRNVQNEVVEKEVLINNYYYKITKDLDEGISIDNEAEMLEYNSGEYEATISVEDGYIIDEFEVKIGGEDLNEINKYYAR